MNLASLPSSPNSIPEDGLWAPTDDDIREAEAAFAAQVSAPPVPIDHTVQVVKGNSSQGTDAIALSMEPPPPPAHDPQAPVKAPQP
eukprot:3064851-Rhodomonas_salina.1